MSNKMDYAGTKALEKIINGNTIYLMKSWDFVHGKGWVVRVVQANTFKLGFGFHSKSRFTAYRKALDSLSGKNVESEKHLENIWFTIAYGLYAFTLRNLRRLPSLLKRDKVKIIA